MTTPIVSWAEPRIGLAYCPIPPRHIPRRLAHYEYSLEKREGNVTLVTMIIRAGASIWSKVSTPKATSGPHA